VDATKRGLPTWTSGSNGSNGSAGGAPMQL
jgi:hypothetical protein